MTTPSVAIFKNNNAGQAMAEVYSEDIWRLGELLGVDLSHWLSDL